VSLLSRCLELVAVISVRFTDPTCGQITTKLQLIVIMTPSVCFHPFYVQTLKHLSAWFYQVISTYMAVILVTVVTFTLTLFEVFKEIEHYFRNFLSSLQGEC
jgi:hypothetical protein